MNGVVKKEAFTLKMKSEFPELDTDLNVVLTWKKKSFFIKEVSVFMEERDWKRGQLYLEPRFERVANQVISSKLTKTDLKNVRWFHYNPFHRLDNLDSIDNYSEVMPIYKGRKIVDAKWEKLNFLP